MNKEKYIPPKSNGLTEDEALDRLHDKVEWVEKDNNNYGSKEFESKLQEK